MRSTTRTGSAGRVVLGMLGLPLAIVLLALAARSRATLGAGDGVAGAEALPPAITNPKGPDGDGRHGPQAPDDRGSAPVRGSRDLELPRPAPRAYTL